jgi:ComF family protein
MLLVSQDMFRTPLRSATGILGGALAELFPRPCHVEPRAAQRGGWQIDAPEDWCHRCGAASGPGAATPQGCSFCVSKRVAWHRIERLNLYADPIDRWIIAMKFARQWSWAAWFGRQLSQTLDRGGASAGKQVVVTAVPMHWLRRWKRGFNQSQLIAQALAHDRGWPIAPLLRRTRYTPPQTSIPHGQRAANVRNCFAACPIDLTGWEVWLIDDVKTTGSTLTVCTNLLRRAGAVRVNIAVAAVADPRGTDFTRA